MISMEIRFRNKFEWYISKFSHILNQKLVHDYSTKPFVRYARNFFQDRPLICAEIGVCHGYNALNMLKQLNIKKIYLIDSYKLYKDYKGSGQESGTTQEYFDKEYDLMVSRMKPYKDKVKIMKMFSNKAHKCFKDNFFDFVYIDTFHTYEYIKEDFFNWYLKIKNNGILGGHGFEGKYTLPFAIIDICRKHNLKCNGEFQDWWIVKNKSNGLILNEKYN